MLIYLQDDIDKDCYRDANKRPLVKKVNGGTQYTVTYNSLKYAQSKDKDLTVVITSGMYVYISQ